MFSYKGFFIMNFIDVSDAVFKAINRDKIVKLTRDLIRAGPITGLEEEAANILADFFWDAGIDVWLDEALPGRPNVVARVSGVKEQSDSGAGARSFLFHTHIDVVPVEKSEEWDFPPFEGVLKDGRIYGRGACDDLGTVAAAAVALKALSEVKEVLENCAVYFVGVVDEEKFNQGVRHLVKTPWFKYVESCVVSEPTGLKVVMAHKGNCWFRLQTKGKAAHASFPEKGINAILMMMKLLDRIKGLSFDYEPHQFLGPPTINIGTIRGGVKINVVPAFCNAEVDIRIPPSLTSENVIAKILENIEALKREDPSFKADFEPLSLNPPFEISEKEDLVQALIDASSFVLGKMPEVGGISFFTEAAIINNEAKVPCVVFGPTGEPHALNENVSVEELEKITKILALTAIKKISKRKEL